MSVEENWLANLRSLVDKEGGNDKRAGYRVLADLSGLSEEYIYQLYEGKPKKDGSARQVGKVAARKIASAFANGRPLSWFDNPPTADPQHSRGVAHFSSAQEFTMPPEINREQLMNRDTVFPRYFTLAVPDEAMAPNLPRGTMLIFETGAAPEIGDTVLVSDASGTRHVRKYCQVRGAHWEAQAINADYASFESQRDGLAIVAVQRFVGTGKA